MINYEIEEIRNYAAIQDTKIRAALRVKYKKFPPKMLEDILERLVNPSEFIDLFLKSTYPKDRLGKLIDLLLNGLTSFTLIYMLVTCIFSTFLVC